MARKMPIASCSLAVADIAFVSENGKHQPKRMHELSQE